ncbi:MAG TPA: sigma-70 family RNA polymerase sigma factor [Verrucomicrobiae bacterium]|jgi:RNA polymerase sigma factor (TIGR02999 family)|nr:sigma-70 family RNA polymerase sigma factor [Verrucomicrobiae bacterium]
MNEITQILLSRQGGGFDSDELLPLVYNDLRRMAAARMASEAEGQTLQPTALVHEAWMRIFGKGDHRWMNRGHFFGEAAEAMRRILIERARGKSRLKRGHGWVRLDIDNVPLAEVTPDDKVLLINDALERLETEDPERAKVVVMKFFGGLTNQETAKILGVAERTVERQWAFAKAWLFQNIREQM